MKKYIAFGIILIALLGFAIAQIDDAENIIDIHYKKTIDLTTTYYNATTAFNVSGLTEGLLGYTSHNSGDYDSITLNITERVSAPALDLRINFTNIPSFNHGIMRYKTSSLSGDYPMIQLWDYNDESWENYATLGESTSFTFIDQPIYDHSDHLRDGIVQMRVYKALTGNINNKYYIDWIAISDGIAVPTGNEIDPFSYHIGDIVNNTNYLDGYDSSDFVLGSQLISNYTTSSELNLFLTGLNFYGQRMIGAYLGTGKTIENEIPLKYGWNVVGFISNVNTTKRDINVSVVEGVNLLAYSALGSYPIHKIRYTNQTGSCYYYECGGNINIYSAQNNLSSNAYSSLYRLNQGQPFWVNVNEDGNITFEKIRGSDYGQQNNITWASLRFSNGTEIKTASQAGTAKWITSGGIIKYWDTNLGTFGDLQAINDPGFGLKDTFGSWESVYIWTLRDNLVIYANNTINQNSKNDYGTGYFDNITVDGTINGNGSQLTDICLMGKNNTMDTLNATKINLFNKYNLQCVNALETGTRGDVQVLCGDSGTPYYSNDLYLYHDFENVNGNTIYDVTGKANATNISAIYKTGGTYGNYFNFSQSGTGYINVSINADPDDITISMWIRKNVSSLQAPLLHWGTGGNPRIYWRLEFNTNNPYLDAGSGALTNTKMYWNGTLFCSTFSCTLPSHSNNGDVWYHIVTTATYPAGYSSLLGKPIYIGYAGTTHSNKYWQGDIDEVTIFNRILSADEILELYNAGRSNNSEYVYVSNPPILNDTMYLHNGNGWQDISTDTDTDTDTIYTHPTTGAGTYTLYDSNSNPIADIDEYGHVLNGGSYYS